jgi:hypothetical protein
MYAHTHIHIFQKNTVPVHEGCAPKVEDAMRRTRQTDPGSHKVKFTGDLWVEACLGRQQAKWIPHSRAEERVYTQS